MNEICIFKFYLSRGIITLCYLPEYGRNQRSSGSTLGHESKREMSRPIEGERGRGNGATERVNMNQVHYTHAWKWQKETS